jgi:hypothetical protein
MQILSIFIVYYLLFVPTNAYSRCPLALCVVAVDLDADIFRHCLVLHILLNYMVAFVFTNFGFKFL